MARNRIAGIVVEIGGDTTKLTESLKSVNTAIRHTQEQLRDVNKLLKLDPGNADLLAQKQKYLSSAIEDTRAKLKAEKDALKQLQEGPQTEETIKQQEALTREIEDTEQKLKGLTNQYKEFGSVAGAQLQAAGKKMQEVGGKISDVGGTLTKSVTLPLAAMGAAGAANFAEVDKTMQLANKTMGNTADQAKVVNDAMKEAAANSTYGMSDAANATLNFARAGLSAEQSAAALAPAMNLAAGEGGDLDTVSGGLVATINGFHGSFDEASKYADIFASACNNSALDVNSLSEAMSIAAPIFSSAGYSVKDASLYMGIMANAGIDANTAATSLKTGLARLVSPAKEGATAMEQLGINVTNADGSMKGSVTIQRELHDAFSKLSESEQIAAASAIFGKNQMAPWLSLINTAPDDVMNLNVSLIGASLSIDDLGKKLEGSGTSLDTMRSNMEALGISSDTFDYALKASGGSAEDFVDTLWEAADSGVKEQDVLNALGMSVNDLQSAMDSCNGTTQEMADTMMSGFGGSIEKLKSSVDVLMYSLGESLAPVIQKVVDHIQSIVDKLNAMDPAVRQVVVTIALVAAAIGPVLVAVGKTITAIGTITSAVGKAMSLIKAVKAGVVVLKVAALGPLLPILAGIAAAIAVVIIVVKNWGAISTWFKGVWEGVCSGITTAFGAVKNFFSGVGDFFSNIWNHIAEGAKAGWETIKNAVVFGVKLVASVLDGINQILMLPFEFVWQNIKDDVTPAFEDIRSEVSKGVEKVGNAVSDGWNTAKEATAKAWDNITGELSKDWEDIRAKCSPAFKAIGSAVGSAWDTIKSGTTSTWDSIKTSVSDTWNGIKESAGTAFEGVKTVIGTVWDSTTANVKDKWNEIRVSYDEGGRGISGLTEVAFDQVKFKVTSVMDAISAFTGVNLDGLKAKFTDSWFAIRNTVVDKVFDIQTNIKDKFSQALTQTTTIFSNIQKGITDKMSAARDAVKQAIDKIKGFFNFKWSLPKLKMPHFDMKGKFSFDPPSVPKLNVSWYKKAMNEPYILNSPTLFGMAGNSLLGGGEAGEEAVVGTNRLSEIVQAAVAGAGGGEQNIIIPVYIGQDRIDEIVVKASKRSNFRSGGR